MARTKTSKAWLQEHVNDPYVQKAKAEGWRSRASFKLMEIDDLDERLYVGPTTGPVGECPRARSDNPEDPDPCGALSYPTWEEPADDKSA